MSPIPPINATLAVSNCSNHKLSAKVTTPVNEKKINFINIFDVTVFLAAIRLPQNKQINVDNLIKWPIIVIRHRLVSNFLISLTIPQQLDSKRPPEDFSQRSVLAYLSRRLAT